MNKKSLIIFGLVYLLSPISILPANLIDEAVTIYFIYKKIKGMVG